MSEVLGTINEKEKLVLESLLTSYKENNSEFGYTDVNVEGFSKMQVGAYVTILSNKNWIKITKGTKGSKQFTFTDLALRSFKK